ncbi:MAG TPA: BamA/TamA family outer membrane protein [Candidatus Eremiobacteraeota bacterium]|nr:BamA/TamA family outer membrane protein [Candidatus Eremiobacteraeota bacterium]
MKKSYVFYLILLAGFFLNVLPVMGQESVNIDISLEKEAASIFENISECIIAQRNSKIKANEDDNIKLDEEIKTEEQKEKLDTGIVLERAIEKPEMPLPEITTSPTPVPTPTDTAIQHDTNFTSQKVVEVEIQGNQYIPSEKILSSINIKSGDNMSTDLAKENLQNIFDMGYFTDVKFDPEFTEDGIKIVYRVLENPRVKSIEFKGNEMISSQELLNLIQTKTGEIFNSNTFEKDLKAINEYYTQDLGMTGIPTHITDLSTPEPGVFVLTIVEGLKITGVDFTGNTVVSSDELRKALSTKPGEYLNVLEINRDLATIAKTYESKYLYLDEPLTAETSPGGIVTFILTEGRVEKFVVSGNDKTKDHVILRELRLKEGDLLNTKILSDDIQKIYNLQFFEEVNLARKPTGKPGYLIIEVQVKEAKTGLATAGVGFSGGSRNEGITGSLTLSERNLFGTGRSVQLLLQRGGLVSNYSISYMEPYLTAEGTSLGFSLFHSGFEEQRQPIYNVPGQTYALFTDRRTGGSVTVGHPLTETFRLYGSFKISKVDSFSTPNKDNPVLARNTGSGDVRSLLVSGIFDTRDDYADPHTGLFTSFSAEKAGWLGGDFDFSKYTVDARKFFPVGSHTIALRFLGGTSTGDLPLADQFYLGGNDTLRAYEQGEFLGDRVFLFQAEYRFPILKSKVLQGAVFFDAGNASAGDAVKGLFDNIKTDEGIGVRIAVPALGIGVIRVDYAIKNSDGGGGRIAIGIGHTF